MSCGPCIFRDDPQPESTVACIHPCLPRNHQAKNGPSNLSCFLHQTSSIFLSSVSILLLRLPPVPPSLSATSNPSGPGRLCIICSISFNDLKVADQLQIHLLISFEASAHIQIRSTSRFLTTFPILRFIVI